MLRVRRVSLAVALCAVAGARVARSQVLPTRYVGDRFYALPVTTRGDTVSMYLDTGGGTLIWDTSLPTLGLTATDSIPAQRGGYIKLVAPPAFIPERTVPNAVATSPFGTRLAVRSSATGFESFIVRSSLGQFGTNWFGDRIWNFDYAKQRVALLSSTPAFGATSDHVTPIGFRTDSTGRRLSHSPNIAVVVDGDTLIVIVDTGAAMWLSPDALAQMHDNARSERATSLIRAPIFAAWRTKHPDWKVIEHADLLTQADIMEVPRVTVAGHTVGPVWFMSYGPVGAQPPQTAPANAPNAPPLQWRFDGTVGGSLLKYFNITLDYPRALAEFRR